MPFIVSLAFTALSLKTLFWKPLSQKRMFEKRAAVILKYLISFFLFLRHTLWQSVFFLFFNIVKDNTKYRGPLTLQPQEHLPPSGLESFSSPFITSENYSSLASCHYTELLKGNQSLDDAGGKGDPTDWCRNQTEHYQRRNWCSIYKFARKMARFVVTSRRVSQSGTTGALNLSLYFSEWGKQLKIFLKRPIYSQNQYNSQSQSCILSLQM